MNNKLFFLILLVIIMFLIPMTSTISNSNTASLYATNTLVPKTAFEIDGNKTNDGGVDWVDGVTSPGVTPVDGNPTTGIYYSNSYADPGNISTDDSGTGGTKLKDGALWPTGPHEPNNEDDLIEFQLAIEQVTVGAVNNDIFYASFERVADNNGQKMVNFIFFDDGDGIYPSGGDTNGDWLVVLEFDPKNNGSLSSALYQMTAGTYVSIGIPAASDVEGKGDLWDKAAKTGGNFGEVAINLTSVGITLGSGCSDAVIIGQVGTAAGLVTSSQIKDVIEIEEIDFCSRDYGDLPDIGSGTGIGEYETLSGNGGPSHVLTIGGPYLGSTVDSEVDGNPNEAADGDDVGDGNNDDDGVVFISNNTTGTTQGTLAAYTAHFQVTAGTAGILNAWIDWDGDGAFDGTNETIASDLTLTVGTHDLYPTNIGDLQAEVLYHRWRFTANVGEGGDSPNGEADNGEVEDYRNDELPLPVELTSFTVNDTRSGVLCEWLTESEIENLGFILERKTDGDWETVASYKSDSDLMGQGTTSAPTAYKFLDGLVEANTTYTYRLADVDYEGVVTYHAERSVKVEIAPNASVVDNFMVLPAYPNPFNPTTNIEYAIPENGLVTINIYDLTGSRVKTLVNKEQIAGWHQAQWNGENDQGVMMSAGMYLVSINTGQNIKTMKLLLVK